MIDRPAPSTNRICNSMGSLAWVEPTGVIHWIDDSFTHPTWAYMHLNPGFNRDDFKVKSMIGTTTRDACSTYNCRGFIGIEEIVRDAISRRALVGIDDELRQLRPGSSPFKRHEKRITMCIGSGVFFDVDAADPHGAV